MAEKETKNNPKDLVEATPEEVEKMEKEEEKKIAKGNLETQEKEEAVVEDKDAKEKLATLEKQDSRDDYKNMTREERAAKREKEDMKKALDAWVPKTAVGKAVRAGEIKDINEVLSKGKKILESEIIDLLLPLQYDLLAIGQAKGKFGGGKRRAWRQTQKKTKEGNVMTFSAMAVVGDKKEHIGIGFGRSKETLPSRTKAIRQAKLNLQKIRLGYESKESGKLKPHTVPYIVEGKSGSVRVKFMPAPRGTGLVVGDQVKKILRLAGIQDVYGKSTGHTRTTFNLAKAAVHALTKTNDYHMEDRK
jgi:small subunit ribosomal protein S5